MAIWDQSVIFFYLGKWKGSEKNAEQCIGTALLFFIFIFHLPSHGRAKETEVEELHVYRNTQSNLAGDNFLRS